MLRAPLWRMMRQEGASRERAISSERALIFDRRVPMRVASKKRMAWGVTVPPTTREGILWLARTTSI